MNLFPKNKACLKADIINNNRLIEKKDDTLTVPLISFLTLMNRLLTKYQQQITERPLRTYAIQSGEKEQPNIISVSFFFLLY